MYKLLLIFCLLFSCKAGYSSSFLGKWEIGKVLFYSDIYALDPEQEKEIIGSILILENNKAIWKEFVNNKPFYETTIMDIYDYNTDEILKYFPEGTKKIKDTLIYKIENNKHIMWEALCRSFIMIDKNTMIVGSEGVYFLAKRIE